MRIAIMADANTRALSGADPSRQARAQKARKPLIETIDAPRRRGRAPLGAHPLPDPGLRGRGRHVARPLRGLLLRAPAWSTTPTRSPPGQRQSEEVQRLADWMQGREEVHIAAPGTDIKLGVEGPHVHRQRGRAQHARRRVLHRPGRGRRPRARSPSPSPRPTAGREVARRAPALRGRQGRRRDRRARARSSCSRRSTRTPARGVLGELGIGTNYGIATGTKEILLDEKIGGTVHLAIGASYPETGGVNESAVHWDMVCDLRQGGSITVDGVELQRDGTFRV